MRAMQQLYAAVARHIKNPLNTQYHVMHSRLSCTAAKSDAAGRGALMFVA
jgi:hypothetical protein